MKKLLSFLWLIFFLGCATPQITEYKKPGIDFPLYHKIAVLSFDCINPAVGQEVSDIIAFSLRKKGYDVIERSRLKAIIDEANLSTSGLTDTNLTSLKIKGISSILVGSVTRYDCEQSVMVIPTKMGPAAGSKNLCHVSLSVKMLDVTNGDIIWAAQASFSDKGKSLTAAKALQIVIDKLEPKIP